MAKRKKLTKTQTRRIQANLQKCLENRKSKGFIDDLSNEQFGPQEPGVVISRFGQHADIQGENGDIVRCNIRRAIDNLVCGDHVEWRRAKNLESENDIAGVVVAVHERQSVLIRPDAYDGIKPVAANIDQLWVVSAILPALTPSIIDRYIVAAEEMGMQPILVLNKIDLITPDIKDIVDETMDAYRELGYEVVYISTKTQEGMENVTSKLKDKVNLFVGQSGVGKSSLVNAIYPESNILTQIVSENSGLGQHTTTVARLHQLPQGGQLIDSPGVREFSLWHLSQDQILNGFIEFRDLIGCCRFRDCQHKNDPGCALIEAVDAGKISEARFDSYQRIIESLANKPTGRKFEK